MKHSDGLKRRTTTDEALRELGVQVEEVFPFQYYYEDISLFDHRKMDVHWHDEFEFITVERGVVDFQIGGLRFALGAGDGLFINTGVLHSMETKDEGVIPNILFTGEMIAERRSEIYEKYVEPFIGSNMSHLILRQEADWQWEMLKLLDDIYRLSTPDGCERQLGIHIRVCELWEKLWEHREAIVRMEQTGMTIRAEARLRLMMQFIEDHFAERITLGDIAASANISKSVAIRCFQTGMQTSPLKSVKNLRLSRAKKRLLTTADTVTDIAYQSGFENCSYFDRAFKEKYGMTPRMMRRTKQ